MFNDPAMIQKLAANPKTSGLLGDSSFMAKLNLVKSNPNKIGEMMGDPRFMQVMSVLLGIDMQFANPGDDAGAAQKDGEAAEDSPMPDAPASAPESANPAQPAREPTPEPEPEPEDEEAVAAKKAKEEADAERRLWEPHPTRSANSTTPSLTILRHGSCTRILHI